MYYAIRLFVQNVDITVGLFKSSTRAARRLVCQACQGLSVLFASSLCGQESYLHAITTRGHRENPDVQWPPLTPNCLPSSSSTRPKSPRHVAA